MGQIKHKMGKVGGGVDISHKSKMSNAAKNQMSFPGGMPGPGNYGSTNNVVGRGMMKYVAGESVGIGMRMGKPHGGPEKGKAHKNMPYKLGDLSVDAGIDNNPEVTRADIITGAKKNKSGGAKKSGGPAKEKKLPTYDKAYDKLSEEQKNEYRTIKNGDSVKGSGREAFKKKAKKYNKEKYGTEEPSKDSSEAGLKRKDLAENKKIKDETKKFDGSGSNKERGTDSTNERVTVTNGDASTRKGRKAMKDADKKSGLSRKEIRSRKLQRKANAAADSNPDSKKAKKLQAKSDNRKERLNKNKK